MSRSPDGGRPQKAQEAQKPPLSEQRALELAEKIRALAFSVHKHFRHGHLEKVYENALANRLRKAGFQIEQQAQMSVFDEDGTCVGNYFADILVEGGLILELKAVRSLADEHVAQVLGYIRAAKLEHGMLINFGAPVIQFKKLIHSQLPDQK